MYFVVSTPEGEEVDVGDSPGNTKSAVSPGKYVLELVREKWIKTLTDDQRRMDVELSEGEQLDVDIHYIYRLSRYSYPHNGFRARYATGTLSLKDR